VFSTEAVDATANLTAGNVLTRGVELAGVRAESATHSLAIQGPGAWAPVKETMSARAAAYQMQITGHDVTQGYLVNGVKFDGFANGVLTDAKGYYAQFVSNGEFVPWFSGQQSLVSQAQRQLAAAGNSPVQWVFAERRQPLRSPTCCATTTSSASTSW
jgi:hypothetical protein